MIQKTAPLFIASKFLGLDLTGSTFKSCIIELIVSVIAAIIVENFGGGLLSLAAFLLSSWPFLFLWVQKKDNEPPSLTHKEATILSASSSFNRLDDIGCCRIYHFLRNNHRHNWLYCHTINRPCLSFCITLCSRSVHQGNRSVALQCD